MSETIVASRGAGRVTGALLLVAALCEAPQAAGSIITVDGVENGILAEFSTGTIRGNVILGEGGAGVGVAASWFSGLIEANEISGFYSGIEAWLQAPCPDASIIYNHVHRCHDGIPIIACNALENNTVEDCTGFGIGILGDVGCQVTRNVVRWNDVGIFLESGKNVSIDGNDVYGNASHDLECWPRACKPFDLDATMNWWGTTDHHDIADAIRDCADEPTISCCVVFDPFCMASGCEPTTTESASWGTIKAIFR